MRTKDKTAKSFCPVCHNSSASPWLSKFERTYYRCSLCRHVYVLLNNTILETTRGNYVNGTFFRIEGNEKYYTDDCNIKSMRLKLDWINSYHRKGKLLDIGANSGYFLKVAEEKFESQGIEISPYAVEWSKRNLSVNNTVASIEDLPDTYKGQYDVITMWDVIEHLPSWEIALKNVTDALKPGGLFLLTTPDLSSMTARLLGKHWYHLHPIQHLHIFNKTNIIKILNSFGFEILGIQYWGRYYSLSYVFDRLTNFYLSPTSYSHRAAASIRKVFKFVENKRFYFSLHDVLGICARKKEIANS
ncbi:class I SAM-dependent methyltransferase [Planctomycetota bacterium]